VAGGLEVETPELITPKRGEKVVVKLRWCIVRGQVSGMHGGSAEHGVVWQWPYVRDISRGHANAVRAVMPVESVENHGLYGVVFDTGEKAGTLELFRLTKIEDDAQRLMARGHNEAAWALKRYEGAEALFIADRDWESMITPR